MKKIVEAVLRDGERRIPMGLVSIEQAAILVRQRSHGCKPVSDFEFSHPAYEAGKTDVFISWDALAALDVSFH